jgi:hypothetical protein
MQLAKVEPYGFFIVIILSMINGLLFRIWIYPVMDISSIILKIIVSPLTSLLN